MYIIEYLQRVIWIVICNHSYNVYKFSTLCRAPKSLEHNGHTATCHPLISYLLPPILYPHTEQNKNKKSISSSSRSSGLPLIGNLQQLHTSAPHRHLWRLSKQYGPLMSLRLATKPAIVVSSARMAREIMKTHDVVFASRPSLLGQMTLSYNGSDLAFAPYSEYWREMKKLCMLHLFNSRRSHSFCPVREDEVKRMIRRISHTAASRRVVNLSEILMAFTSSSICWIAFGKRCGVEGEGSKSSKFHGLLNEAQALYMEFFLSDYRPCLGWVDRLRGLLSRLDRTFKQLDLFCQEVIDDHMDPTIPQIEQEDIVDIFLQIMGGRSASFDLTLPHIKDVLMNIFIAGTDTSASTMVWAMTSLIKNPTTMKKVQQEIRNLHGNKGFISEDDIQSLPYLNLMVKETLRLFPPAQLLVPRELMEKCNIEGYEIEAKTLVFVNV